MPVQNFARVLFLSAFLMVSPALGGAQTRGERPRPPDGGVQQRLVSILIPAVPHAPFSATVSTESVRMLADGSRITLVNHRAIARDAAGRIFQERRLLVPPDRERESVITQIEISDPVAHQLYICKPGEQVCQLESYSPPVFAGTPSAIPSQERTSREDLGKQFIGGLEAVGTRETTVVEPGAIGNDSELHIVREYWYSPQLSINLSSKLQDPRIGTQDFEVSDVVPGEPDPKLFKIAPGSEVIDLRRPVQLPSEDQPHH
ncbi:MAG TPA: hypothetical protein VHS34_17510 [Terriglobales bacterium]|jgi:hypothetical protein|nr:hypothetical protein [Terriglobales bacterium]